MYEPLFGRENESEALQRLLSCDGAGLLTITGPGGMGKTTLALALAQRTRADFEHGAVVVPLTAARDSQMVVTAVAQALGLQSSAGSTEWKQVEDYLRERRLLLVLDNFEQVLQAATLVGALLLEAPRVKILVTSRVRLHLKAEQEFVLGPLQLPVLPLVGKAPQEVASVQLFVQRARAHQPQFTLDESNAQAVAALCVRLDGWPLAIELAAARIKIMTPQQMLQRLQNRLGLLAGGPVDQPERQRTLRGTLDWSHELLSLEERELFARLSVFNGGAELDAIEAVCAGAVPDVLQALQALVDHSLLRQQEDGRFVLLETIREYAAERLQASDHKAQCQLAHALYFLALAEQAERHQAGPHERLWFARVDRELDNVRAALSWSVQHHRGDLALRTAGALGYYSMVHGLAHESLGWIESALRGCTDERDEPHAKAMSWAGMLAVHLSDLPRARDFSAEAWRRYQALDDQSGMARTSIDLGWMHMWHDANYEAARRSMTDGLVLARAAREIVQEARGLVALGSITVEAGDFSGGLALLEQGLALTRVIGDESRIAIALANLGHMYGLQGLLQDGCRFTEEALAIQRERANRNGIAICLGNLGEFKRRLGDLDAATALLREGALLSLDLGASRSAVLSMENLALVCLELGDPLAAAKLYGAAQSTRERYQISVMTVDLDENKSMARERLGEPAYGGAFAEGELWSMKELTSFIERLRVATQTAQETPRTDKKIGTAAVTDRELEVLRLVVLGLSDKEVAQRLSISSTTVSKHVANLLGKSASRNRLALAMWAFEQGLAQRSGP